jgi:hypothetical protein
MMKIAVVCKSPLLQKSIEMFLPNYLSSPKNCDLIISDEKLTTDKNILYISAQDDAPLQKPFTKAQLFLAIEKAMEQMTMPHKIEIADVETVPSLEKSKQIDFSILEERIKQITQQYQDDILRAIKIFYEK